MKRKRILVFFLVTLLSMTSVGHAFAETSTLPTDSTQEISLVQDTLEMEEKIQDIVSYEEIKIQDIKDETKIEVVSSKQAELSEQMESAKPITSTDVSNERQKVELIPDGDLEEVLGSDDVEEVGEVENLEEGYSDIRLAGFRSTGGKTQADAEAWIDSMHGKAWDYDGVYGVQCVDLISYYYRFLGHRVPSVGFAYNFVNVGLPQGWARYRNNVDPKPGDIVVYGANEYGALWTGHIGIVRSVDNWNYKYLDFNGGGHNEGGTWRYKPKRNFTCIIRPDFAPPAPPAPERLDPPSNSANIENGDYIIHSILDHYRSLAWEGDTGNHGQNVFLRDWPTYGHYIWTLERQADNSYTIRSKANGKFLDVSGGPTAFGNEVNIQIWPDGGTANQRWYIVQDGDGYKIIAKHSGYAVDVRNAETADGTNVQQYRPNGSSAQRFNLLKAPEILDVPTSGDPKIKNATYIIRSTLDQNKVVSVDSTNANNGRNVHLWQNNYHPSQIWEFQKQSDGSFCLKNQFSGKYMDVVSGSIGDWINILAWEFYGGMNQHWYIVKNDDGTHRFVAKHSGYVMDVARAETNNGTNIQQYNWTGHNAQRFILERYPAPTEYLVTFLGKDGAVLETQHVEDGEDATAPTPPQIQGYAFAGWDKNFENIRADMTVRALYNQNPSTPSTEGNNTGGNTENSSSNPNEGGNAGGNSTNPSEGGTGGTNANNTTNPNTGGTTGNNIGTTGNTGGGGTRSSGGGGGGSRSGGGGGGSRRAGSTSSAGALQVAKSTGTWSTGEHGWRYTKTNHTLAKAEWLKISDRWYYFNTEGYMTKGWILLADKWYYMVETPGAEEGKMATGWIDWQGKKYYLSTEEGANNGMMLKDIVVEGKKLGSDGAMQ